MRKYKKNAIDFLLLFGFLLYLRWRLLSIGIQDSLMEWDKINKEINTSVDFINYQQDSTSHGILDILSEQELNEGKWEEVKRLQEKYPEKMKLFFGKDWIITTKENFEELMKYNRWEDIKRLIIEWKTENMKLFFGKDWIIKNIRELGKVMENYKWDDLMSLIIIDWEIEHMKVFFWKDWIITTKKELENLMNDNWKWKEVYTLIEHEKKEVLEVLFGKKWIIKHLNEWEKNKSIFTQNRYIENDKNALTWNYIRKERSTSEYVDFAKRYKGDIWKNAYIIEHTPNQFNNFFSQTNWRTEDIELTWMQEREKNHNIGKESYFDINSKNYEVDRYVQLAVNRLFAPLFPMTRLLKLINWESNYVSIDVEDNEDGIVLCQLKEWIDPNINKFFIMIYQFLTLDYDRNENENIWKKWIIYDHDWVFPYHNRLHKKYWYFFNEIFDNEKKYPEMGEILYTLKDYLTDEVERLLEYYAKQWEDNIVKVFEKLRIRLDMLNFSNLIYYNEQVNPKIEAFARKIDHEYYR